MDIMERIAVLGEFRDTNNVRILKKTLVDVNNQFLKYEDLITELIKLNRELRNESGVSYMRYGVVNHSLSFKGSQLSKLEVLTFTISGIISEITEDLTYDN